MLSDRPAIDLNLSYLIQNTDEAEGICSMIRLAKIFAGAIAAMISAMLLPATAGAAEFKGAGSTTFATVTEEITKFSEDHTLTRFHLKGVIVADDPDIPINLSAQDCMGTVLTLKDDKTLFSGGSCDATDNDGDIWWLSWISNDDGSSAWKVTGGTGKYKGMTGSGKSEWIVQMSDGRSVLHWDGKWIMK